MKRFVYTALAALLLMPVAAFGQDTMAADGMDTTLLPPDAKVGECYTRVWVDPTYRTETQQVLKSEASSRIEVQPASYEWGEEQILVKESSEALEVVPATYKWVEEQLLVKPASSKLIEVPAQYETVSEQVVDVPAHTVWKKGRGLKERVDNSTGEIMCLVEVPATYKTVTKRVLRSAARVEKVEIPAEYKTVRRRVVDAPASVRKVDIPAQYDTVRVRKLVTPPKSNTIDIPAEYQTVTNQVLAKKGHMAWRSVLCETNTTPTTITALQSALSRAGYDPGSIDGVIGDETLAAIHSYQLSKGLPTGGVTIETMNSLGL